MQQQQPWPLPLPSLQWPLAKPPPGMCFAFAVEFIIAILMRDYYYGYYCG
jgi:hypothetical protein